MTAQRETRVLGECLLVAATLAMWWPATASAVHLTGRIISVGFPSTDPHGRDHGLCHYKLGRWTPVRVDLTNTDGDLFSGWLEVRQPDRDGDLVVARQQISIRDSRHYFLYVPAARNVRDVPFNVRVVSTEGSLIPLFTASNERIVELTPEDQIIPVDARTLVILDISAGGLNHLRDLTKETTSDRDLIVARCAPSELPDLVAGLEMVDVIVWDAADPSASEMDLGQREALIEWVRRGGRLVLGVSANWDIVSRSAFGEMLPARLSEPTTTTSTKALSPHACDLLFGSEEPATSTLLSPLKLCSIKRENLLPDAESVIPFETPELSNEENILAASRPYGRGRVVLVTAEMRELLQVGSYTEAFLRQVVRVKPPPKAKSQDNVQARFGGTTPTRDLDLHETVEKATNFSIAASLYFLFAFMFVVAYIIAATFGSWTWLKKKGLARVSWPAFAALSVAASATSLLAVRFVRGIGNSVECFTVVDGKAGSPDVGAICYLGMKTATYSNVDLSLPSNWLDIENSPPLRAALRPRWYEQRYAVSEATYAASTEYKAAPVAGQLHDVLFRATEKQFEGRWEGTMAGRLNAALYRKSWTELGDQSWIENKLGADLDTCYLFVAARGFSENRSRHNRIHCYPFKALPDGKRITVASILAALPRQRSDAGRAPTRGDAGIASEGSAGAASGTQIERLFSTRCEEWAGSFGYGSDSAYYYPNYGQSSEGKIDVRGDKFTNAMLLLTFFDEIDQADAGYHRLDRSQGRVLDRSSDLTLDTALFVGFANDPGPARLCWRRSGSNGKWKPIDPDQSRTMYRFTIPIRGTRGQ